LNIEEIKALQRGVGVTADGLMGRGTLAATFRAMGAKPAIADALAFAGNVWLAKIGVLDSKLRFCHHIAQLAHESDNFNAMEEYASGQAYEGRADLGNTEPGDGKRFKGRGPIQCTGRNNYRKYGRLLGINIEAKPTLVSDPEIGYAVACLYWDANNLNRFADADDIDTLTRRINGGTNGLADRKAKLNKVRGLFR